VIAVGVATILLCVVAAALALGWASQPSDPGQRAGQDPANDWLFQGLRPDQGRPESRWARLKSWTVHHVTGRGDT
jgi:hypothetical protein